MTHFVIIVIADNEEEVDELLKPFSEYTEVEPYFNTIDVEEMAEYYEIDNPTPENLKPYVKDWVGYEGEIRDGELGCISTFNKNSRYDWHVIGGRWGDIVPGNQCKVSDIPKYFTEYLPSVIVSPDGWHASKEWGWWETYNPLDGGKKEITIIMEKYKDHNCYIVDCHI